MAKSRGRRKKRDRSDKTKPSANGRHIVKTGEPSPSNDVKAEDQESSELSPALQTHALAPYNSLGTDFGSEAKGTTALNNTKLVVFFLTAPHEEKNRGDTDYLQSVIDGIKADHSNIDLKYVYGQERDDNGVELYDAASLCEVENKIPRYQQKDYLPRRNAVQMIEAYIRRSINDLKTQYNSTSAIFTILHLQLRAPETGCMIHPEEIYNLKKLVDKFVITCHEWRLNENSLDARKNQSYQLEYMQHADNVIFLNDADREDAIQAAGNGFLTKGDREKCRQIANLLNKCSLSNISATLPPSLQFNTESVLNRPRNILIFGLMRKDKGFEEGIKLAEYIKENKVTNIRTCFAGNPHDLSIARKIIISKWNLNNKEIDSTPKEIMKCCYEYKNKTAIESLNKYLNNQGIEDPESIVTEMIGTKSLTTKAATEIIRKLKITDDAIMKDIRSIIDSMQGEVVPEHYKLYYKKKLLMEKYESIKGEQEYRAIDIEFSIDANQLDILSERYKYCYKVEKKGFANNSSSIINALHRRLITFTNKGSLTSKDFLPPLGCYNDAVILLDSKESFPDIVTEIEHRESEKNQNTNRNTLTRLESVVTNLFSNRKIATDHLQIYNSTQKQSDSRGI